MLISNAAARAIGDVAAREEAALEAFEPTMPEQQTPLTAAAPDGAYFVSEGSGERRLYTAGGTFAIRGDGVLVDQGGYPLLGYRRSGGALETLRVDGVDLALGYSGSAAVAADGTVSYERRSIDPVSGRAETLRTPIGRLALARFPAATKLQSVDLQHAAAPAGIAPHTGVAGDGAFGAVQPFAKERSVAQLDSVLDRMQEAYLAIDALRAAAKAGDGVKKTALDLLK